MKKNITINMQGRLFAIDEDAYNLLKQYEDSLRSYFSHKDGGEEIVNDLEERIAELFDDIKSNGKVAIDIDDVQRIIKQIGNPQQMDDDESQADSADANAGSETSSDEDNTIFDKLKRFFIRKDRRFYRDMEDKKIFGVMSGLSHYYGGDVTIWRIVAVVIGIISLSLPSGWDNIAVYELVLYFVLGLVVPDARTAEDKLRMKGKKVNPENIAEEVTNDDSHATESNTSGPVRQSQPAGCLATLGDIIIGFIKIIMWFIVGVVGFVLIVVFVSLLMMLFAPSQVEFNGVNVDFLWTQHPYIGILGLVSFIVFIVLSIYGISHAMSSGRGNTNAMSGKSRIIYLILLVVSLAGSIACASIVTSDVKKQIEKLDILSEKKDSEQHEHNGVLMADTDWDFLKQGGWTVLSSDYCNDHFTSSGEYYTGNADRRYLDSYDDSGRQMYLVEHTDSTLESGTYTLSAVVRSDGEGAYIYAKADGKIYKIQIPAEGNTGGQIWQDATAELPTLGDSTKLVGKAKIIKNIADANNGNGYGWSRVKIEGITTKTGRISYGLTSLPKITSDSFTGTWFSADEFRLTAE